VHTFPIVKREFINCQRSLTNVVGLKEEWKQSDEVVFDWLKRNFVLIIPGRELDSFNESFGDLYFHNGGKSAFPNLRDILEKHFNKVLTVEGTRNAIKLQGVLKFKEWAFDPTIEQRLNEETEAYLQTYTPFGAGGETITRSQSDILVDKLLKPDGPRLVLLTGIAGSGKSGIVRKAINKFRKLNIPHLAFRVDQHLSCSTREELGKNLTGRGESPVSTLKGTFPDTRSFLFIDQVDAVSEVSGRDGKVKEVIFRMIKDADNFEGIRIVVVCRTFDLDSDPRLKGLKDGERAIQIDVPLFDWKADVEPLLKNKGIDTALFNEPQRQLLCLPVNLSVFLEIDDPELIFYSRSNLHEKLIEKKQRIISNERKPPWSLIQPLTAMCDWMSRRQELSAPVSVMDAYPNAADILTSEGLIISSRGKVNFFHESFFDHVYARAFLNHDQSLVDLLSETEQHLFRRTQVRQILEALRQNDVNRYLLELSSVLFCNDIRYHIKAAACHWLSTIEGPTEQEFEIISQFDVKSERFHHLFRSAVLSSHSWFDLLHNKSWIRKQIDGGHQDRAETVLWWLKNIAGERPKEIASILKCWWGGDPERTERILNWFGFLSLKKLDDDLFHLCDELINSRPCGLFKEAGHNRIRMILHTWLNEPFEHCGQILHSIFQAWFALNPGRNSFEREKLKIIDTHSLSELAKKAPQAFLLANRCDGPFSGYSG